MGVLYAAREHGLKVPRDLSVIGVDGHDFAYLFDLTTISQPVRDQGRIAARLLLEQVNSHAAAPAVGGFGRVRADPARHDRTLGPASSPGRRRIGRQAAAANPSSSKTRVNGTMNERVVPANP